MTDWMRVAFCALACAILGLIVYHLQDRATAEMNLWGVITFAATGASLACLAHSHEAVVLRDLWRGWW